MKKLLKKKYDFNGNLTFLSLLKMKIKAVLKLLPDYKYNAHLLKKNVKNIVN